MLGSDPEIRKRYGRAVRGINQAVWEEERFNIVLMGTYAKFDQNTEMRQHLLYDSGDKLITEESPYDAIWGIGLRGDSPGALNPSRWRGKHLVGSALQQVWHLLRAGREPPRLGERMTAAWLPPNEESPRRGVL